jgi:hypothetical protein
MAKMVSGPATKMVSGPAKQKWCQVPQSDIDELFIYKFVGPSSLCAKNLDSEYTLG